MQNSQASRYPEICNGLQCARSSNFTIIWVPSSADTNAFILFVAVLENLRGIALLSLDCAAFLKINVNVVFPQLHFVPGNSSCRSHDSCLWRRSMVVIAGSSHEKHPPHPSWGSRFPYIERNPFPIIHTHTSFLPSHFPSLFLLAVTECLQAGCCRIWDEGRAGGQRGGEDIRRSGGGELAPPLPRPPGVVATPGHPQIGPSRGLSGRDCNHEHRGQSSGQLALVFILTTVTLILN